VNVGADVCVVESNTAGVIACNVFPTSVGAKDLTLNVSTLGKGAWDSNVTEQQLNVVFEVTDITPLEGS